MRQTTRVLGVSFIANAFLTLMKIIVGFLGRSQSLIADGLHSFSDLSTDVVALVGNKIANRPADEEHPFGHGRLEYITSMIIGIVVLTVGFTLIKTSILSSNSLPDRRILFVIGLVIAVKYFVAVYLLRSGKRMKNQILISSGRESMMDVVSSVFVFFVVILAQFQTVVPMFAYLDRVGGILIGLIISFTGVMLIKDNISILIGKIEQDETLMNSIRQQIDRLQLNLSLYDLFLIKYGPYYQAHLEVLVPGDMTMYEFECAKSKLNDCMKQVVPDIEYTNIQVKIEEVGSDYARKTRGFNRNQSIKRKNHRKTDCKL